MDKDRSGSLCFDEVTRAMRDYHISTDQTEIKSIFEIFDLDHSGRISYDEFLRVVVGQMNERRRGIAALAFNQLDWQHDGVIDLVDIKRKYNAKKHPDVL